MMRKASKPMDKAPLPVDYMKEVRIPALEAKEAKIKADALSILAQNLSADSLAILASKSQKKGINDKIKKYKHFM